MVTSYLFFFQLTISLSSISLNEHQELAQLTSSPISKRQRLDIRVAIISAHSVVCLKTTCEKGGGHERGRKQRDGERGTKKKGKKKGGRCSNMAQLPDDKNNKGAKSVRSPS